MKAFDKLGKGLKPGCAPCALKPRVGRVSGFAVDEKAELEKAQKMTEQGRKEVIEKLEKEEEKPKFGFVDLLFGALPWGAKVVEAKAREAAREAGSETANEVADTARAIRLGTYAAATIGTLGVIGYVVRSFK